MSLPTLLFSSEHVVACTRQVLGMAWHDSGSLTAAAAQRLRCEKSCHVHSEKWHFLTRGVNLAYLVDNSGSPHCSADGLTSTVDW